MKNNIGEAILILGCIYFFTIIEGWSKWLLLILIGLALSTWGFYKTNKYEDEVTNLQIRKLRLDIALMDARAKFYVARGAAIMRRLKQ